ncbi:MAG: TetR/AcrR family transcriptional regulator [Acidimicrobiia bacterium]|nr:TetR/AcrR family transcriptional regulator [Acidimicrobiia bacterium]
MHSRSRPKPAAALSPAFPEPTDAGSGSASGRELRERGKRTMAKLLDAGTQVFAKRGYHAARVDDIVKVAKTSHGTFYLYFLNKEDLFQALAEQVATAMYDLANTLPPVTPDEDGAAALRVWLNKFSDLYRQYGPIIRAWTEAEIGDSGFGRLGTGVLTEFGRVFVERVRQAAPPNIEPTVAAMALVAMIERVNYYVLSGQVHVEQDAMVNTLAAVTQASLFGTPLRSQNV